MLYFETLLVLYICLWLGGYENRDWDTEENTICAEKTRLWREINWLMEPCKSLVGSVSFQGGLDRL